MEILRLFGKILEKSTVKNSLNIYTDFQNVKSFKFFYRL